MFKTPQQSRINGIRRRKEGLLRNVDINNPVKISPGYFRTISPTLRKRYNNNYKLYKKAFYKALTNQKREIRILNSFVPPTTTESEQPELLKNSNKNLKWKLIKIDLSNVDPKIHYAKLPPGDPRRTILNLKHRENMYQNQ